MSARLFSCIENNQFEDFCSQVSGMQNLDIVSEADKWTLLMASCFFLHREPFVSELLRLKADPNFTDESGDFPLFVAAERNNSNAIDQQINGNADVNKVAADGLTSMHICVENNNAEAVEMLLLHRASQTIPGKNGKTVLDVCEEKKSSQNPVLLGNIESIASAGSTRAGSIGAANMIQAIQQAVSNDLCTITATGSTFIKQKWWHCKTCSPSAKESFGCCEVCYKTCHKGHELVAQTISKFYCDCGTDSGCKRQIGSTREAEEADVKEYSRAVELVMIDGHISHKESTYLLELRNRYKVSDEQHEKVLQQQGLTIEQFLAAHKPQDNSPGHVLVSSGSGVDGLEAYNEEHRMKITAKEALIIGVSKYKQAGASLKNPQNDAKAVESVLKTVGFNTNLVLDIQTYDEWVEAVTDFSKRLTAKQKKSYGCVGFFYFAGHAVEMKGSNYLLHGEFTSDDMGKQGYESKDLTQETMEGYMSSQHILQIMEKACNTCIMIQDACRNNPFAAPPKQKVVPKGKGSSGAAAKPKGTALVPLYPTGSTLVLLSTAPGFTAGDGSDENKDNGMFTNSLIKFLGDPSVDIEEIAYRVARDVYIVSQGKQHPWRHSALLRKVFLADSIE